MGTSSVICLSSSLQISALSSSPPADNSRLVFDKHNGSVFCCNLSSSSGLVVTGGEDDRALIWRLEDGKVEEEVAGWGDSVTAATWSKDGNFLALADMSGSLRVLRCPGYEKVWT